MPTSSDLVDPVPEEVPVLLRQAEHVGDHADRDVAGVEVRHVAAPGGEGVDQGVAGGAGAVVRARRPRPA